MADCGADGVDGWRGSFADQVLKLGKDLFDGVHVWRVFWQEEKFGADRTDGLANCFARMAAEVIQHDGIAGSKGWRRAARKVMVFQRPWRPSA